MSFVLQRIQNLVAMDAIQIVLQPSQRNADDVAMMQLLIPGFGVMQGRFVVSELSYGGEHDGEAVFSVRLASAGAISF